MFNTIVYQPFLQALIFLYGLLGNNLGFAIITLTLLIRLALFPITLPSLKSANNLRKLKPQLDKLKRKYGKDKKTLQQEQLKLYKKENINPAAGCLPQILQLVIFFALYRVFINFINEGMVNGIPITMNFLWLNLSQPDQTYILPIIAGVSQLVLALMISPGADATAEKTLAAQTPDEADDKKAEDVADMAQSMQTQMIFIMPALTFFFALRFPSGLAIYWIVSTIFAVTQQYFVSGWGGLTTYPQKGVAIISKVLKNR